MSGRETVGDLATAVGAISHDLSVDVTMNQVGFLPGAQKTCVLAGEGSSAFAVIGLESGEAGYRGALQASRGDLGAFRVGDFSALQDPGTYYVQAGGSRSYPFRIGHDVYDPILQMMVRYFSLQRCGLSATGYLAPCHCDDGVRLDNGAHQDVTGGWHDASDLRKWVGATLYGMIGLARTLERLQPEWGTAILDELRWGNRYFLAMQEPAGYVMSHVGGDVAQHADSNRWTDNLVGEPGGQVATVAPLPGGSSAQVTVIGAQDDRVIQTAPLDRFGQHTFCIAEATMARLTRQADPDYSARCLTAASRCLDWCIASGFAETAGEYGAAIGSAVALYRATGQSQFRDLAADSARRLAALQVKEAVDSALPVRGFHRTSATNPEPYRDIWHGCWQIIGLCELIEALPGDVDAPAWRDAVALYARDYLLTLSRRSAYAIVPFGLFAGHDPGGNRRVGTYWYRYSMPPRDWWVGINANLASAGVGLLKAARILQDARLSAIAQRQLDWILGANPFYASTVEDVGHNHPRQFVNSHEFRPPTPRLPGAVMNGLGGTVDDQPDRCDGSYHTAEYWTPMVAYTMWLMAELERTP